MKYKFISFITIFLLLMPCGVTAFARDGVSVSAGSYVLYCADSKQVLVSGNKDEKLGMASTTKVMTALITLEKAAQDDKVVEFTEGMIAEGSSMYLKVGDKVKLSDLAAGMMTVSGNDAANAAAVAIGGSLEGFADIMNSRAKAIGMNSTHFVTPSGLSDDNHYSTSYDMALLMSYAMENEAFASLTKKKSVTVDFVHPQGVSVTYHNHNRLLSLYDKCIGGKTGYTMATGRCLVTCAEYKGLRLVAVTLNDRNDWADHKALYEYGFGHFAAVTSQEGIRSFEVPVMGSEKSVVSVSADEDKKAVIPIEDKDKVETTVYLAPMVFAPVKRGVVLGKVRLSLEGEVILEYSLVSDESAEYKSISLVELFFRRLFG